VAEVYGCAYHVVYGFVHANGMEIGKRGPKPKLSANDLQKIVEEHRKAGLDTQDIADAVSMSVAGLRRAARQYGIDLPDVRRKISVEDWPSVYEAYVEDGQSLRAIGDRFGVSGERIRQILAAMDAPKPGRGRNMKKMSSDHMEFVKKTPCQTKRFFAKAFKVSSSVVARWFEEHFPNYVFASHYDVTPHHRKGKFVMTKGDLPEFKKQYYELKKPIEAICHKWGVSVRTVYMFIHRHGLPLRRKKTHKEVG
jgi:transposase